MRPGYLSLAVDTSAIKPVIYEHAEFAGFIARMEDHFNQWRNQPVAGLKSLAQGCHPKTIITELSEGLLNHYAGMPLIGNYDVYQHLMDYWAAIMQDDCYLIAAMGGRPSQSASSRQIKKAKRKTRAGPATWCPRPLLWPATLRRSRRPSPRWRLNWKVSAAQMAEQEEEHGGEEGLFAELGGSKQGQRHRPAEGYQT